MSEHTGPDGQPGRPDEPSGWAPADPQPADADTPGAQPADAGPPAAQPWDSGAPGGPPWETSASGGQPWETGASGGQPWETGTPAAPPADPYALAGEPGGMAAAGWGPADTLSPDRPKSRKGLVLGAAAAVLAVVAAGGIYVATSLSGGGTQPEALAPASTFAFTKIDLDPAANQKVKIRAFADHFPGAPKSDAGDVLEVFVAAALESVGEVDYERDVEPWLGKRVGIAGFTDPGGQPTGAGILQVGDEAKARETLDRLRTEAEASGDDFAYEFSRGYVVVAETAAVAKQAAGTTESTSLSASDRFQGDLDRLTGDQVLAGWVDIQAATRAASGEGRLGGLPPALGAQMTGRAVFGAHAEDNYVELEGLIVGSPQTRYLRNGEQKLLTDLPADTVAAISVNNLSAAIGDSLGPLLGSVVGDPEAIFEGFEQATGLSVRNDLLPLLGEQTVLALGAFDTSFATLRAALLSVVKDPRKAAQVGEKLEAAGAGLGVAVETSVEGNTFTLAYGSGYAGRLRTEHGLGATDNFKAAMGELGDGTAAAMYVDMSRVVPQLPFEADGNLRAVKAVGVVSGARDDAAFFRLRVVAG